MAPELVQVALRRDRRAVVRTFWEDHGHLKDAALPYGLFLARYSAFPDLEIKHALCIALWLGEETEGMVLPPLPSAT
jgi:hypothetical protein